MVFTVKYRGLVSCKFSHHPILWTMLYITQNISHWSVLISIIIFAYDSLVQPDQATVCHCSTTTGDMGDIGDTGDRCATTTGEDIGDVNTVEMGDATGLRAMPAIGVWKTVTFEVTRGTGLRWPGGWPFGEHKNPSLYMSIPYGYVGIYVYIGLYWYCCLFVIIIDGIGWYWYITMDVHPRK